MKNKKNKYLLYDTYERPTLIKWIILAFQHIFAMFGATILVPILVNKMAGSEIMSIPISLICSGIGTLIYILCTRGKSPIFLGSSFSFISPIASAFIKDGRSGYVTGLVGVGLIYVLFALLIKKFGIKWVNKLLPPVVIGPMIMIIGLALALSAVSQIGLTGDTINIKILLVATISFLTTAIVSLKAKGFLKIIPFLIGMLTGYVLAIILGLVDFSSVGTSEYFAIPRFLIPIRDYTFSLSGLLTIAPIALVSIAEHIGDHMALSTIINKDLIEDPGLDKSLMGDGLATCFAGLIGGPANTSYGENTSVVGMTKVASVWVTGLAAVIAIIMSFLGKFISIISTIPDCVLGGVSLLLYGFISVNGLKVLIEKRVNVQNIRNVIIISTMLTFGLGGAIISISSGDISVSLSGMSLAAIAGILLNLFLPKTSEKVYLKN